MKKTIREHEEWRGRCWNLIASENITSPAVAALLVNDLSHRYGDYEGIDLNSRKYRGNRFIVQLEKKCHGLGRELFGAEHIDLRPLSGHIAGVAPLFTFCKPGDTVLELSQECGGHRLGGKLVNCPLVPIRTQPLPFDADQFNIDVRQTLRLVESEKPRFIILGSSTFLFPHPVADLRHGIDTLGVGTLLQYDASHVLGLIAGKRFQKPLAEGADLITSSTHKTLGGPQGGLVLTNSGAIAEAVGKALQPGLLSNHHLHRLPALCQTFQEWLEKDGTDADRIVAASQALAAALERLGISVVASHLGYTASHTILVQTKQLGSAKDLALALEDADILAGACRLPGQWGPEGLRLGTQEVVRRGMRTEDMEEVASVIAALLKRELDPQSARKRVNALARKVAKRADSNSVRGSVSHD
ncbi:MAG: serine hydroxymethyltransferase [Terriglobia bacterium]